MAANLVKKSASIRNGNVGRPVRPASYAASNTSKTNSSTSLNNRHSLSFPVALDLAAVKKMEANDIVEILKKKIAFIAGGCDLKGCLIISIPARDQTDTFTFEELISTLSYLSTVPRNPERLKSSYCVIVDARGGSWTRLRMTLRAIQHCLGKQVMTVLVVKPETFPDKELTVAEVKRERAFMDFQINFVYIHKLIKYVDKSQLTVDFEGTLPYNHPYWLKMRLNFERFVKEANAVIRYLDTVYLRMYSYSYVPNQQNPEVVLSRFDNLYLTAMDGAERVHLLGCEIVVKLEMDGDSGFKKNLEIKPHADLLQATRQVKKLMESLCQNQLKLRDLWITVEEKLSERCDMVKLEETVDKVVNWIQVSGENMLNAETQIGRSFLEADELRKSHEQLELHCTETYGLYAEVRHQADIIVKEKHPMSDEIVARRRQMDNVCCGFAGRLERRRNLLILSVKFHRTVQEIILQLHELVEYLQTECTGEELNSAETSIRRLENTFTNIVALQEQIVLEGDRLIELMTSSAPSGAEVTRKLTSDAVHVRTVVGETSRKIAECEELVVLRTLRLKQIVQLSSCERDAQQVIVWILELCSILVNGHFLVGCRLEETHGLLMEHRRFEDTGKGTYDYGRQLLQTALSVRRSCGHREAPNTEIGQRLFHAWKTFLAGSAERTMRLKVCMTFYRNTTEIRDRIQRLLAAVKSERRQSLPSRQPLVARRYASVKERLVCDVKETTHIGRMLLERLLLPVIPEYRSTSKGHGDADGRKNIADNLRNIEKEMDELEAVMREFQPLPEAVRPTSLPTAAGLGPAPEDWHSLVAASSVADDWHTCPSDITSADEYFSADDLQSAAASRRTSSNVAAAASAGNGNGAGAGQRALSVPSLSAVATTRQALPEARRSFFTSGAPQSTWQEVARSSEVRETTIAKVTGSGGQQSLTVSKQHSSEQWRQGAPLLSASSRETSTVTTTGLASDTHRPPEVVTIADVSLGELPAPLRADTVVLDDPLVDRKSPATPEAVVRVHTVTRAGQDGGKLTGSDVNITYDGEKEPLLKQLDESKEWLQLKILEMEPDLSKIGTTSEEALEFQRQHEDVLIKLQTYLPKMILLESEQRNIIEVPVNV